MTIAFDQHAVNHMIVAINREMTPLRKERHADFDTLFMGGGLPTEQEQEALARFGMSKNFKVVFLSFDPGNTDAGPIGINVVVTDGLTESFVLQDGRLWKKDRRSAAILLFPQIQAVVRLNTKGQLVVGPMAKRYADHGYDLAIEAITACADRKPGLAPVISSIGSLVTVLDMRAMADSFAAAE